jgi:carbamoyltransferase
LDDLALAANMIRSMAEEAPAGFQMLRRKASPTMDAHDLSRAFHAPKLLAQHFGASRRVPIIHLRHHDNHAWFSYGVSPFAGSSDPVMVAVMDGTGDDSSISLYVVRQRQLERVYQNDSIFDSVGQMYMYVSSTQGGWPPLSSEGRYMGAAAWGNGDRYMVLTAPARPEAYDRIPAVIHHDGTSRVQIVRQQVDPLMHAYLRSMGRYIGAEVSVNTSLNVGSPIVQTPSQAVETLKRARGMDGLFFVSEEGDVLTAWHNVCVPPKDAGRRLQKWMAQWSKRRMNARKMAA